MSSGSRRQTAEILGGLGRQICRSLGGFGSKGRIPNPIPKPPSASLVSPPQGLSILPGEYGEISSTSERGPGDAGQAGNRTGSRVRPRVLQPPLSGPQEGGDMAPGLGRVEIQQICFQDKVLNGDGSVCKGGDRKGGLDDIPGHEGCVLSHPDPSFIQEIPKVHLQRPGISVQSNVLWTEHCAAGFHSSFSPTEQDSAPGRIQNHPLLGRLADPGQVTRGDDKSHGFHYEISQRVGNSNKPRKVHFGPNSVYYISRHENQFVEFLGFSERETLARSISNIQKMLLLRSNACKVLAEDAGSHGGPGEICDWCQTPHETLPVLHQKGLEQKVTRFGYLNTVSSGTQKGPCMVVEHGETQKRSVIRKQNTEFDDVHRCLKAELGGNVRGQTNLRNVVSERTERPYQRSRAEGHLLRSEGAGGPSKGSESVRLCRQHDSSSLHQEAGGNEIMEAVQAGGGAASMDRGKGDHSSSKVHRREEKQGSRYPESEGPDNSNRMDTQQPSVPKHLETLGTSSDRCIRNFPDDKATLLFLPSPRPERSGSRCPTTELGQQRSLRIPSLLCDQESDQQGFNFPELQTDIDSPMVATEGVVPGPSGTSRGHSKKSPSKKGPPTAADGKGLTSRPVRTSADRMEVILKLAREKGLSKKVSERIVGARATSTNSLYQLRWSQFVKWCRENRFSAVRPSIDTICKFFIFLWEDKKLSVGTIKGFRSVLHSVLRHNAINISQNQDISDVIRSFIIERPVSRKDSVSWNIDIVLKYLCSRKFEPLNSVPIKELTKKTLFLLTMALAKRVSEMQAISCEVGFTQEGAVVSLILTFRAKNDNKVRRLPRSFVVKSLSQLVGHEEERKLCPVRALRYYLERTKSLRGNTKNLFLAPRNTSRPASKNGLAYYLRTTVLEAHREVSEETLRLCKVKSQEVRAVSTSLSFAHNLSIDAVVEAAQWRSNTVFASHYLKEVSLQYENCRSLGPIVAAGTIIE